MDAAKREAVLAQLESLCASDNYVSFEGMPNGTGLTVNEFVDLKPELERRLRRQDPKLSLTSRMDLDPPGFFVDA